tara:strand:+ start:431 stop:655 length:225 start_codon:yes stop_codon:yes gene_type:complete
VKTRTVVLKTNVMAKRKSKMFLPKQKMTKQKTKLLVRLTGGEIDNIMWGSPNQKMKKGGKKKLGGGTHNTYSGK